MRITSYIRAFAVIFAVVFITSGLVSFLYSLIAHGVGVVDWESSFRFAVIFGVILPLTERFTERRKL